MATQYISESASANSNNVRNTKDMYIDGKLGIGTISPGQKAEVSGMIKSDGLVLDVQLMPPNNTIYLENGSGKLRFKDGSGNSHDLY